MERTALFALFAGNSSILPVPGSKEWEDATARYEPDTRTLEQRQADNQRFDDWFKARIHEDTQARRAETLRLNLEEALGRRLLAELYSDGARGALSAHSKQMYKEDIARFKKWCAEVGVSFLPATGPTVATFILETCAGDDGPKPAMAARLCTAIKLAHRFKGMSCPVEGSPHVRAVRKWIKQSIPPLPLSAAADIPAGSEH